MQYPLYFLFACQLSLSSFSFRQMLVVYLHECHAIPEWTERMNGQDKLAVAACHDENVAKAAKAAGFKDIFYSKKCDTTGLTKTVLDAVEFAKSSNRLHQK